MSARRRRRTADRSRKATAGRAEGTEGAEAAEAAEAAGRAKPGPRRTPDRARSQARTPSPPAEPTAAPAPGLAPATTAVREPLAASTAIPATAIGVPTAVTPTAASTPSTAPPTAPPADKPPLRPGRTPEEAFDLLYARGAAALLRQVELLTGDPEFARETVTHAYDLAWQRWPEVARDGDPAGWVRAAAYEYALAPWHRWVPGHRRPQPGPPGGPLEAALLGLPPAYRKAVLLHDGLGLDLTAAAAEVESTAGAAAARVTHARQALAAAVPGLDDAALPARLGELLDTDPDLEPPDEPQGVRDASERGAGRRMVGGFALAGVIAVATILSVLFGPIHPDPATPRRPDPDPRASARAHPARAPGASPTRTNSRAAPTRTPAGSGPTTSPRRRGVPCATAARGQPARRDRARRAVSDGVLPTLTPAASRASFLACAVPEEPETMAPAWPIVLPSGAVKPAT